MITTKKDSGETHDAFELRTWRERMHVGANGNVIIPGNAIKNMMTDISQFLSESVPGKRNATYTKFIDAGLMVFDDADLGVDPDTVEAHAQYVPSDGKKGGGSRVLKYFPIIPKWQTQITLTLVDPVLMDHPEKVIEYLEKAGQFIGLGRWRARKGGMNGRFTVKNIEISEVA